MAAISTETFTWLTAAHWVRTRPELDGGAQTIRGVQYGGIFTLAVWNRTDGTYVYLQEQDFGLECYEVSGGSLNPTPVFVTAPTGQDVPYDGLVISGNGGNPGTGVLWETTGTASGGTLRAFDASNLMNELWNSDLSGGPDTLDSFASSRSRPSLTARCTFRRGRTGSRFMAWLLHRPPAIPRR